MDINRTWLGILLAACSVAGVGYRMIVDVLRGYYSRRGSWREAPREFFATVGDAVMTGLGLGLLADTVIFLLVALMARIGIWGRVTGVACDRPAGSVLPNQVR